MAQDPESGAGVQNDADNNKQDKKKLKAKQRKATQKLNKQLRRQQPDGKANGAADSEEPKEKGSDVDEQIIIEYVSAPLDIEQSEEPSADGESAAYMQGLGYAQPKEDPFTEFKKVFEKFATAEQVTGAAPLGDEEEGEGVQTKQERVKEEATAAASDDEDDDDGGKDSKAKKMGKKQRKLEAQLKIAELKTMCERPDVVEVWDITSHDPPLLVFLKGYRNTVPVPRHWSQKRKYLQGKRGLEKPPFKLPDFIEATGISKMREAYVEKEAAKQMKQKQRERMAPKMGRMDIDYQVLHDAFFKYQTRPKLTSMGELYYEGKEFEARVEGVKPGVLSEELRKALGMSEGAPPPWLINMQRYGPPPSYPNLRIPGLNAPIPPGAQFGYHPGGWGKPPVDEEGNALYGDVFGLRANDGESDDEVDKSSHWGELEPEPEEESEEEEEESEKEEEEADEAALAEGIASGMVSGLVSGMASGIASSLPSGIETPDVSVQLRKGNESAEPQRPLYTVLEQRAAPLAPGTLLGTDHVYVIPGTQTAEKGAGGGAGGARKPGKGGSDVEVTLTPEEMEGLDEAGLKALYEEKLAEARSGAGRREDFSDMVAARAAAQKRKLAQKADTTKKQKKDFKF